MSCVSTPIWKVSLVISNLSLCFKFLKGEAIAHNLREMFGLKVPIITTVIGEGGSGGALAIGCCDKMIMLENAVYYVARCVLCLLCKASSL